MTESNTIQRNMKLIFYVVIVFYILLVFTYFFKAPNIEDTWYNDFGKSCYIKVNGKYYSNVDISNFRFNTLYKNSDVIIKTRLPKKLNSSSNFVMHTWYSAISVYAGKDKLYSYGYKLSKKHNMVGSGYHFVGVPHQYEGKYLTVKIKTSTYNSFRLITFFKICKRSNCAYYTFYGSSYVIIVSFFLIIFGLTGCFGSVIFSTLFGYFDGYVFYVFLAAFLSGLWENCSSYFFHFICKDYELGTFLEFASLYLLVLVYITAVSKIKNDKVHSKIFYFAKITYIIFLAIAFTSHFLKIKFLPEFLPYMHGFTVIELCIVLYIITKNYSKQQLYEKILLWGCASTTFLGILQIILFNIERYIVKFLYKVLFINVLVILASIILLLSFFISYIVKIYHLEHYEREIDVLKRYAFKDNLTKLDNRESATRILINLVQNNKSYHVIMFDINNLKLANDMYGHERGDKLIKDFADCLSHTFSNEKCEAVRYGGDEFLVILREYDDEYIDKLLKKLQYYIDLKNLQNKDKDDVIISAAHGVAKSEEIAGNKYAPILELADKRMYKNKVEMKKRMHLQFR